MRSLISRGRDWTLM
uniref:Uncharacterized protein n=1 Tax=Anguilla anguilla TaxID=7936 RepID=A0A0E9UW98_ANGAN